MAKHTHKYPKICMEKKNIHHLWERKGGKQNCEEHIQL
jgi:hypothetical protein